MKRIAQADFLRRVPVDQQEFHSTVRLTCRTQAGFSDTDDSHYSDVRPEILNKQKSWCGSWRWCSPV